jgi:hypothetical protein
MTFVKTTPPELIDKARELLEDGVPMAKIDKILEQRKGWAKDVFHSNHFPKFDNPVKKLKSVSRRCLTCTSKFSAKVDRGNIEEQCEGCKNGVRKKLKNPNILEFYI